MQFLKAGNNCIILWGPVRSVCLMPNYQRLFDNFVIYMRSQMMITKAQKDFITFTVECLIGTVIGFLLYRYYPVIGAWSLFSIILVLAPDRKDAMALASSRIKANLIGAFIGLIVSYFHPVSLLMICLGVAVAMTLCEWINLKAVTKSAVVAILIITMHDGSILLEHCDGKGWRRYARLYYRRNHYLCFSCCTAPFRKNSPENQAQINNN